MLTGIWVGRCATVAAVDACEGVGSSRTSGEDTLGLEGLCAAVRSIDVLLFNAQRCPGCSGHRWPDLAASDCFNQGPVRKTPVHTQSKTIDLPRISFLDSIMSVLRYFFFKAADHYCEM